MQKMQPLPKLQTENLQSTKEEKLKLEQKHNVEFL